MSKERVVVAMSGGVDSSVAAAILKKKGYDVIGITMRFWNEENRCCRTQDLEDAKHISHLLKIPHYTVSFDKPFKKQVVDYFVKEYCRGRTPNPCAVCNPVIKFGKLLEKTTELNARYLATGHYAIISHHKETERYILRRGKERGKDQSYFLARLPQNILNRILFPVGTYPKNKIRQLAERLNLPVAKKKESQEVCFIPDGNLSNFIREFTGKSFEQGEIIDQSGTVFGTHQGIIGYTIGQRKGLGIATGKPVYVTKINPANNTIIIGPDENLYHKTFTATGIHWFLPKEPRIPIQIKARIRYTHRPKSAQITPLGNNSVKVTFKKSQRAITPGQLAVFYDHDIVVGSAWIDQVVD